MNRWMKIQIFCNNQQLDLIFTENVEAYEYRSDYDVATAELMSKNILSVFQGVSKILFFVEVNI